MNGGRAILANASPTAIKALLKRYNLGPKKRLGQHFLWQSHVVERIAESAELTKDDVVLEIGPGLGILTEALARQAGMVIAVEIDRALFPLLQEVLQDYDNIRLVLSPPAGREVADPTERCFPSSAGPADRQFRTAQRHA
jgi:16S rRNA (adenine1518-N6/adenine1519-N6)-dimethyltransferase